MSFSFGDEEIRKQGWIYKESAMLRQYRKRWLVLTPERLPILETERAVASLGEARIPVAGMIINRVLPDEAEGAFFRARRERELHGRGGE